MRHVPYPHTLGHIKISIMSRYRLDENLQDISYLNEIFEKFKRQASIFIRKVKEVLEENNLSTSEIDNNSLEFSFWGLDFIIKSEIEYEMKSSNFIQGELNTYYKDDDKLNLILSYNFDKLRNIGRNSVVNDFAIYYYLDFVKNLKNYSSEKKIKFQLN